MIALYIVLGLLLIIGFLLLQSVSVVLQYQTEMKMEIRYLFLKIPLSGEKEEPQIEETVQTENTEKQSEKSSVLQLLKTMVRIKSVRGLLKMLQMFASVVKDSAEALIQKLKIKRFDLYYCVGGKEDAAQAAMQYGEICAAAYSLFGAVFSVKKCRKKGISIDIDYGKDEDMAVFDCVLSLPVWCILKEAITVLKAGTPLIRLYKAAQQRERMQGDKNE